MNEAYKLLKKSFYEDKWKTIWSGIVREKDGLEFYTMDGWFFMRGISNSIHIPVFYRFLLKYHYNKGQSDFDVKRFL